WVRLTVTDNGNQSASSPLARLRVRNLAPHDVAVGASAGPQEGSPVTLTGTFLDPGPAEAASVAWQVTDPSGQAVAGTVSTNGPVSPFTFTPASDGPYAPTFRVSTAGGTTSASATVPVANVTPVITTQPAALTLAEGAPLTGSADFSDPGADAWTAL